jgi:hypothetical protein
MSVVSEMSEMMFLCNIIKNSVPKNVPSRLRCLPFVGDNCNEMCGATAKKPQGGWGLGMDLYSTKTLKKS